jgi:hypothetical protein
MCVVECVRREGVPQSPNDEYRQQLETRRAYNHALLLPVSPLTAPPHPPP